MNISTSSQASLYTYECFIPFHLADPAGILFFGNAFSLAHETLEHFVMDYIGYDWNDWFQNKEWLIPIRHTEANFLSPIQAGKNCTVEVHVRSISQCSFTLAYHFFQHEFCCEVSTVHVFCSKLTKKKIAIPEDILRKLHLNEQTL